MKADKIIKIGLSFVLVSVLTACGFNKTKNNQTVSLINVSYDPTRELYETYNKEFEKHWKKKTGQTVDVIQSHGGSGKQALEVINGLKADVVTLASEADIDAICDAGLIKKGWKGELGKDSAPYTSTIVFLVRKGNPKKIRDWSDLVRNDVSVVTPNPKTSGGARWNFMAAWAYADQKYDGDEDRAEDFVRRLYQQVAVLDSGARGATTSFVENGQGDVLIAWENEAYLSQRDHPNDYEMVTPSISINAQPSVAVVDAVVDDRGTDKAATEYLRYLYSETGQRIAAENYYRPTDEDILQAYSDRFDRNLKLVDIDDFGGWDQVQKKYFGDGGLFDRIYEKRDASDS